MHLHGPDGLDVDWTNTNPGIGGIILDRDVISDLGPCQENTCAPTTSGMPKGEYRIEVDHYSGASKAFQVRVIINGNSESYSGYLNPSDENVLIKSFTL